MAKKPPWRGYLIRGCFGVLTSLGIFLGWFIPTPFTGRVCVSMFFIANGIFTLKYDKLLDTKNKVERAPAYVSVIGGIVLLLFTLSTITLKLFSITIGDVGGYLFGPILIIIGLFQVQGGVRIMPDLDHRLLARSSLMLGILEILAGIAVLIYGPVDVWQIKIIVQIWVVLMTLTMFVTAYRWRSKLGTAQGTQPIAQK